MRSSGAVSANLLNVDADIGNPVVARCGRNSQDQAGITFGAGIASQHDLAAVLDDALVDRTAHGPAKVPINRGAANAFDAGTNSGIDVVTDGPSGHR